MKTFSIILTIYVLLYFFVYACAEKPCTDDCTDVQNLTN